MTLSAMKLASLPAAGAMLVALALPGTALAKDDAAAAEPGNHAPEIAHQDWTFSAPFGTYDNAQLQRGFQVYKDVCSNCHSMRLLSYRNLGEPGGPEFSPKAVEVIASQVQVTDGPNEKGEMFQRPARPSDHFRSPFANDQLARNFNGGALPPDLSVIAKAREGGADYIYALLTGYADAPAGFDLAQGMHYNKAFPGHQIAMPPPLSDGAVKYTDGTPRDPRQLRARRVGLPHLGGGAQARGAPQDRRAGASVPRRLRGDHVSRQAHGVGQAASPRRAPRGVRLVAGLQWLRHTGASRYPGFTFAPVTLDSGFRRNDGLWQVGRA